MGRVVGRGGGRCSAHDPVPVVQGAGVPLDLALELEEVGSQERVVGVDERSAGEEVGLERATGGEVGPGGVQQALGTFVGVEGELGGAGPGGCGCFVAAAAGGALRGFVERCDDLGVGAVDRCGQVPGPAILVRGSCEGVGKGAVGLAAPRARGGSVDGGAYERVAEHQPFGADAEQS